LCIPSYLWFEPQGTQEQIGVFCWILAILCVLSLGIATARVFRSLNAAGHYIRACRTEVWEDPTLSRPWPILVVDNDAPLLAVAGVIRPRIVISTSVLREFSPQELALAVTHEQNHLTSRDTLKRLLMMLAVDVFPFCRCLATLEHAWTRFTEWAADDQAAGGDSVRSVSLASALVHIARMGLPVRPGGIVICFVADGSGLAARVDRLLREKPAEESRVRSVRALLGAVVVIAGILAVTVLRASTWYSVHRALEHMVR
jgi:beta-lactamase regulating signal transducer with metallopeptidase domain